MCLPMSATASSREGSMPRMSAPRFASLAVSIAWPSTYGAAAFTRGSFDAVRGDGRPVHELRDAADLDVRRDGEDAVAQLFLEPVHHRQDDNQRRDAERDAGHRDERDEGDERVAAGALAGARVAQADGQFVRRQVGGVADGRERRDYRMVESPNFRGRSCVFPSFSRTRWTADTLDAIPALARYRVLRPARADRRRGCGRRAHAGCCERSPQRRSRHWVQDSMSAARVRRCARIR